ncbi:MAG: RcpC/CpaB family pilus assembly protein [Actinomycetota bacterium]
MNSRRTVILIFAVVVAAVAAVGILNYIERAETSADEATAPVQVWVVQQPIPKGTPIETALEAQLIGIEETAQSLRPPTAIVDPAVELAGLVAMTDLPVDWPVVTGSFVSPKIIDTGITDRLEETGLVTVTFNVDQAKSAAYLIEPGDFVNVLTERDWDTPFFEEDPEIPITATAASELAAELLATDTERPVITDVYPINARYVYQKAEVLAIGDALIPDIGETEVDDGDQTAASQSLVTLAVPPEAVQVILNVDRQSLYLSLVPDDYEPRPMPPLDPTTQVLPGESEGRLTPYAGYDVVDPGEAASELVFAEREAANQAAEDRSDDESDDGADSGADSEDPPSEDGGQ